VYVGGDNIHPTAAGHIYIRERVAIALRRILADDGTLLNTLI
jgi:lysophospholipase L1-like esterase